MGGNQALTRSCESGLGLTVSAPLQGLNTHTHTCTHTPWNIDDGQSLATKHISGKIVETVPVCPVSETWFPPPTVSPTSAVLLTSDKVSAERDTMCVCVWSGPVTQHQHKQSKNGPRIPEAQSGSSQRVLSGMSRRKQRGTRHELASANSSGCDTGEEITPVSSDLFAAENTWRYIQNMTC